MIYLPDVNVWVALVLGAHTHHEIVIQWLDRALDEEATFAFCRVTQQGLLRLLTNEKVMGQEVLKPEHAWDQYDVYKDALLAKLQAEPHGFEAAWRSASQGRYCGKDHFTDAYLSAFAAVGGFTVVTLDQNFKRHPGAKVKILEP